MDQLSRFLYKLLSSTLTYHNDQICGSQESPVAQDGKHQEFLPPWEVQRVVRVIGRLRLKRISFAVVLERIAAGAFVPMVTSIPLFTFSRKLWSR